MDTSFVIKIFLPGTCIVLENLEDFVQELISTGILASIGAEKEVEAMNVPIFTMEKVHSLRKKLKALGKTDNIKC